MLDLKQFVFTNQHFVSTASMNELKLDDLVLCFGLPQGVEISLKKILYPAQPPGEILVES